jgi:FkbM family methyltransferase
LKIIYDFGAHDGTDISYYLLKAERVIAVEANPELVDLLRNRFSAEIAQGKLVVQHCALSLHDDSNPIDFYVHRHSSVFSQIVPPKPEQAGQFKKVSVPARTPSSIVRQFGVPWYIKCDIEHFDGAVLDELFQSEISPPYISAEVHSIDVFARLVLNTRYKAFKVVSGGRVRRELSKTTISTESGPRLFSFEGDTSGPFGDDIPGSWLPADVAFYQLAYENLGHIDIHATTNDTPGYTGNRLGGGMSIRQIARMLRLGWFNKKR